MRLTRTTARLVTLAGALVAIAATPAAAGASSSGSMHHMQHCGKHSKSKDCMMHHAMKHSK
jgi:hypothetical protein